MTRPSKEAVDGALALYLPDDDDLDKDQSIADFEALAQEVVALREEKRELGAIVAEMSKDLDELKASVLTPSYSTAAVDALLKAVRESVAAGDCWESVSDAADTVAASREPPLK